MRYSVWDLDIKKVTIYAKGTDNKSRTHGVIEFECGTIANIGLCEEMADRQREGNWYVSGYTISNSKIYAHIFNELFNKLSSRIITDGQPAWNLDSYDTGIVSIDAIGNIKSYKITESDVNSAFEDFWNGIDEVLKNFWQTKVFNTEDKN